METPHIWAQICIQQMVDLAEERTTIRRVLDPMFVYFDKKGQWVPQKGLALVILSDFTYLIEGTGKELCVLIRYCCFSYKIYELWLTSYTKYRYFRWIVLLWL